MNLIYHYIKNHYYKNRVNCFFYCKVGACRHGEKCTRIHNKPQISPTIMFRHLYQNPPAALAFASGQKVSDLELKEALQHFEKFYEEIFVELSSFGELKELAVCDNLGDHLIGNVYARFNDEASAAKAYDALAGKYYNSKLVEEEYSPITKISWCRCNNYDEGYCSRGSFCNYLHLKPVSAALLKNLREEMYDKHPEYKKNRRFNFFRKLEKHEHSSSESSLEKYDIDKRKKIIGRWNENYFNKKRIQNNERKNAQKKIDLAILQQKLNNEKKYSEDKFNEKYSNRNIEYNYEDKKKINIKKDYINDERREKNEKYEENSDETISINDL